MSYYKYCLPKPQHYSPTIIYSSLEDSGVEIFILRNFFDVSSENPQTLTFVSHSGVLTIGTK